MSCAATHRNAAALCGIAMVILDESPDEERLLLGVAMILGALFGAKLPDILEPAIHSHHRAFCHSLVFAGGMVWAIKKLREWKPETAEHRLLKAACLGALVGYGSHLVLDASTPRGLPIV